MIDNLFVQIDKQDSAPSVRVSEIMEILRTKRQVFLTGVAGVGKTHAIIQIAKAFQNPLKLASTNQAAIYIGGVTVHSFFGFGLCKDIESLQFSDTKHKPRISKMRSIVKLADLIIIDEISMLSAQILDMIFYRFGQLKVKIPPILFVGDLYQLPPIERGISAQYIFESPHFTPLIIELTKIHRTSDVDFALAQQDIRQGVYSPRAQKIIGEILSNSFGADFNPTKLYATNAQVSDTNNRELAKIPAPLVELEGEIRTDISDSARIANIIKHFQADLNTGVKLGAKVIFIASNWQERYYNGLRGILVGIGDDYVVVEADGRKIRASRMNFDSYTLREENGEIVYKSELTMSQFPIKLAYALTIHKSQGLSIDDVQIDCSGIFTSGQFYVALSRARNPRRVRLLGFEARHIGRTNAKLHAWHNSVEIIKVGEVESA